MWGKSAFINYQGQPQFKTFLGGCISLPLRLLLVTYALSQFHRFALQEDMPYSVNSIYLDFDKLGPQYLNDLELEIGYTVMDEKKNVVDLDRTLYDVDFVMRKFKVVDSKE